MGASNKSACIQSKARSSLPPFLKIKRSAIPRAQLGVYTTQRLPKDYKFGPFEGKIFKKSEITSDMDPTYQWEVHSKRGNYIIDGHDENTSNWMRFVNCARFQSEQNLDAVQIKGKIFYITYKRVEAGKELLVWYGDHCAKSLGIDVNNHGHVGDMMKAPNNAISRSIPLQTSSCTPYNHKFDITDSAKDVSQIKMSQTQAKSRTHKHFQNQKIKSTCFLCYRAFESWKSLQRHLNLKHGKNQCRSCLRFFLTSEKLKSHVKKFHRRCKGAHSDKKQCRVCGKIISKVSFSRHLKTHTGIVNVRSEMKEKINRIHSTDVHKVFQCSVCMSSYRTENGLIGHLTECSRGLSSSSGQRTINNSKKCWFTCKECGKLFSTLTGMGVHLGKVHKIRDGPRHKKLSNAIPTTLQAIRNKPIIGKCQQIVYKKHVENGKQVSLFDTKNPVGLMVQTSKPLKNVQIKHPPVKHDGTKSHPNKVHFIKCSICEGLLRSERDLRVHYKNCRVPGSRSAVVTVRRTSRKQTTITSPIKDGQYKVGNKVNGNFVQCQDCGKCFGKQTNLTVHLRMHQYSNGKVVQSSEWFPQFKSLLSSSLKKLKTPFLQVFKGDE